MSTRFLSCLAVAGSVSMVVAASQGATLLHYDFEENPAATPVTDGQNAATVLDVSGNGYHAAERVLDGRHPQYDTDNAFASTHASLELNQGGSQYSREGIQLSQAQSDTLMGSISGNSFTVEIAFKTAIAGNSTGLNPGSIFVHDGSDSSRGIMFARMGTDGKVRLYLQAYSGQFADFTTSGALNDDQWHHLALQHDLANDKFNLYVDYVLVHSVTIAHVADFGGRFEGGIGQGLTIGGAANDSQLGFDGQVDDLRVSTGALTPEQMLQIPEPASVGLLILGGAMFAGRPSR